MRTFEIKPAVRTMTPILMALCGPPGGGKTFSALRIATGMVEVLGGKIFVIDTEGGRSLDYADDFQFQHLAFQPPHSSLDYRHAIDNCLEKGAAVIVIDSMSHEHEGEAGHLEFAAKEVERIAREWHLPPQDFSKANRASWIKPKKQRRDLIYRIETCGASFILCFRAKEEMDFGGKKDSKKNGTWLPAGGKEFIYVMKLGLLLPPGCEGTPDLEREKMTVGQQLMFKMEKPFAKFFRKPQQLSEELGKALALWANGGSKPSPAQLHEQQEQRQQQKKESIEPPKVRTGPDYSEPCSMCKNNPPPCKACGITMLWRPEFLHTRYGILVALWRCPQECKDPQDKRKTTNVKALDWHAILEHTSGPAQNREAKSSSGPDVRPAAGQAPQTGPAPEAPTEMGPPASKSEEHAVVTTNIPPASQPGCTCPCRFMSHGYEGGIPICDCEKDCPAMASVSTTPEALPSAPSAEPPGLFEDRELSEWKRSMLHLQRGNPKRFLEKLATWSFRSIDDMAAQIYPSERAGRLEAMRTWCR